MLQNKLRIQKLTLAAFFVTIEVLMAFTPIGYIPIGPLSITTMHLPVILAGVFMGSFFGAWMGFVFGLTSFIRATFMPTVTSFVFSPFITIGGISGNFTSLLICFVPRILLGYLSGVMYHKISKKLPSLISVGIVSGINTFLHTILVLGGIYVFFAAKYAEALNISKSAVFGVLMAVVTSNMLLEIVLAVLVIPTIFKALQPIGRRMGIIHV